MSVSQTDIIFTNLSCCYAFINDKELVFCFAGNFAVPESQFPPAAWNGSLWIKSWLLEFILKQAGMPGQTKG